MKVRFLFFLILKISCLTWGSVSWGADLKESVELAQTYITRAYNHPEVNRLDLLSAMNQLMIVFSNRTQFLLLAQQDSGFKKQCRVIISEEVERLDSGASRIVRKIEHLTLGFIDEDGISKLCPPALELTNEELAQALIHEAAHIAFEIRDECRATKWEMSILRLGGVKPYANKYVKKCGIEKLGPYRSLSKETLEALFRSNNLLIDRSAGLVSQQPDRS